MFSLTQYMIQAGVPQETLILLLMVPIIATLIAFSREIIGIKGFGIYTSLIIAFAFVATGLNYGMIIFISVLLVGTAFRFILKRFRLLYLPRIALVLSGVTLLAFFMFLGGSYINLSDFLEISIFPILIIIILIEKFVAAQIERGNSVAVALTSQTLILATISYFIIKWSLLQTLVLDYPLYVFLGIIIINLVLGKWTGLRVSEYFRFKEVLQHIDLSEKK